MAQTAILFPAARKPANAAMVWLARAEQARRLAAMLSLKDAEILEAYALECEANAVRREVRQPAIAA